MTTDPSIKTVLVTGGNGCLGRFIVNLILEKLPYITTVKVFDKNPSGKEYFTELANMQSENEGQSKRRINLKASLLIPAFSETSPEVKIEYLIGDLRNPEAIRRRVHVSGRDSFVDR
jgi:nucleoside-diphosphate-sugar epimerase